MMSPEGVSSREQDERLVNPDAYFEAVYGAVEVIYDRAPQPMSLAAAFSIERAFRTPEAVDAANREYPRQRAAKSVLLLAEAEALRDEDKDLVWQLDSEIRQLEAEGATSQKLKNIREELGLH